MKWQLVGAKVRRILEPGVHHWTTGSIWNSSLAYTTGRQGSSEMNKTGWPGTKTWQEGEFGMMSCYAANLFPFWWESAVPQHFDRLLSIIGQ